MSYERIRVPMNVHRFNDDVAVFIGNGSTIYIPAEAAIRLSSALRDCADDISARKFVDSKFTSWDLEVNGKGRA